MNNDYVDKKLQEAKNFIRNTVGLKPCYFEKDVFMIFKEFGFVETLSLEEAYLYLPTKGYDFSSIESFTKGYITGNNYKIYAIRMEKHFNLFVVNFNDYLEVIDYFSITISDETLNICFILESMKQAM